MAKPKNPQAANDIAMDESDAILTLSTKTLAGDIRDFMLDRLKHDHNPLPWNVRPEKEQRDMIERATMAAERIVRRACEMIAADGRKVIHGTLKKVAIKDVIQGVIEMPKDDAQRHDFIDSTGSAILIVVSDASAYLGARGEVKVEKDQKSLLADPAAERAADLEDIRNAGFKVGEKGGDAKQNPHDEGGEFSDAWLRGFQEGVEFRNESGQEDEAA